MDVNGIGSNGINVTGYSLNASEYVAVNSDTVVQKVQKPEENNMQNAQYSKKDLDDALKKINNFLKDENTHAEYSYYKELNAIMIKVVDEKTNEVILEVPPKKILDMVASMCRQVGLFDRKI